ncbi:solute carrier family 35 member F5 [Eurytemora carolleeae]|uniref:solute carrier family 35 member F5 n=1 Tax=Eurytemora carolleeae TaxID=1294199 RepID=UPI000C77D943|nr:solute carrier family 35 member F5 [Eurytemora carolleeae]|eukprot:XP_023322132.1 solute carrier family 35 member F5-like [Eurytemora affinis]
MTEQSIPEPTSPALRAQRFGLGLLVLLAVDFIWVASSELTEFIFKTQHFSKPFFSTYVKTSLFMLYLPGFILYKPWREQCNMSRNIRRARLGIQDTAQLSLTFTFLFFLGNYSYQAALANTEAGIVNVLSASSCFFTLLLSAVFPSNSTDSPTLTKVFSVGFTLAGVILVSYSDLKLEDGFPKGALWALSGSLSYSAYIVFLRRKIDHEDKLDVPMFFGFVGFFTFISLWPLFLVLHYTELEVFEWPNKTQWFSMLVNGVVGTVLSELLWLFGCFYTSSLVATLAISLTIPLTMFADVLVKHIQYDDLFYVGSVPMFLSFFIVAVLTHWNNWDPILDGIIFIREKLKVCCGCKNAPNETSSSETVENEALILPDDTSSCPKA